MKSYDAATLASLSAQGIVVRGAMLFDFPSGLYGFWQGTGNIDWNGITFKGGAQLFEIDAGDENLSSDASEFTIALRANPEAGLSASVLATIENEQYVGRPVSLYKLRFDPDSYSLINVTKTRAGYVDYVSHDIGDGEYKIVVHCETRAIDFTRRGWSNAADAEQKAISPGDQFYEFTAATGSSTVTWGRTSTTPAAIVVTNRPVL